MIKQIKSKELDSLDSAIAGYFQYMNEKFNRPVFPLKERLDEGLEKKTLEVYAKCVDNKIIGFSVVNLDSVGFNIFLHHKLIEEMNLNEIEIELFDYAFSRMKQDYKSIKYAGPVSKRLANNLKKHGYLSFKRARMSTNRKSIQSLTDVILPTGYKFRDYKIEDKKILADVMSHSHFNKNHPDGLIWSNWNGVKGCMDLLNGIENSNYGTFNVVHNKIIEKEKELIAACFVTKLTNGAGYIPEIVVSSDEKGKGLGKKLLIYSLKEFIINETDSPKVDLDVTIDNSNASKLYSSLGFEETNQYVVYVWNAI